MAEERILIGKNEIAPGNYFTTQVFSPLSEPIKVGGKIEAIRGGGFFGKAMLFKDFVIKTSEPDSWHKLWRHVNWSLAPFPSQSSDLAAQLDVLAGKIIHESVPLVTNGKVITPDSLGYVDLGTIGYGQVLERMRGRGAHFNLEKNENQEFINTRRNLWSLGILLGIEQAAQIHPDNPFGKPNLWTTDNGQMIWLDTLPAIKHIGWVWPAFNFKFHQDVREKIGGGEETFNKIHTEKLKSALPDRPEELSVNLDMYDEKLVEYSQEMNQGKRVLVVEDAVRRGMISPDKGKELMHSNIAYSAFLTGTIIKPALGAFSEFISDTSIYRLFTDKEFQVDTGRFVRDPLFRNQQIIENTILKGTREAFNLGLINDEELQEALNVLSQTSMSPAKVKKIVSTYIGLQAWFTISGEIINAISIPLMASSVIAENPGTRLALGLFVDWVVPPVVRAASVLVTSFMTKQELNTALKVAALPKIGGYLAVSADMAKRFGDRSEMIWHYTKRGLIASLSKVLRPWGGWNSDLEANLWEKLKVEKW